MCALDTCAWCGYVCASIVRRELCGRGRCGAARLLLWRTLPLRSHMKRQHAAAYLVLGTLP
ncbi:hypothetical protein EON67_11215 [archaeon]|nr:MAG: hypothetical protein EON67_11215 [archaeon]